MKNIMKITFAFLLSVLLCGGALAEGTVNYEGGAEKFVFTPGSEYSASDLFGEQFKGVLPGDQLTTTVKVENTSAKSVRLYMRAEPVSKEDKDFLDKLHLTVSSGNSQIFDAQAGETAQLTQNKLLGTFKKKGSTTLAVTLTVPIELDNAYMDRIGVVPWTFLVEEIDNTDDTPQTGDWFELTAWIGSGAAVLALLIVLLMHRKRERS